MRYVPLTQGKRAIIDDEDYPLISQHKWRYSKLETTEYARTKVVSIRMHRLIIGAKKGEEVDHINGNGLDNRKANLRICTRAENVRNVPKRKDTNNVYKGVHFVKQRNKWIARIQINGKRIHSGYFSTEVEAAKEYNKLAKQYHGEFARFNVIS